MSDTQAASMLRQHLDRVAALKDLRESIRAALAEWLESNRPFDDTQALRRLLSGARIKGLSKEHQAAFVDSLSLRISRRPMLAALGAGSVAGVVYGFGGTSDKALPTPPEPPDATRTLVAHVQQRKQTVGAATRAMLVENPAPGTDGWVGSREGAAFFHALDMSDWFDAATLLHQTLPPKTIAELSSRGPSATLMRALSRLHRAWRYLNSTRPQWEKEYFVAYAFGRMPALATAEPATPMCPRYDDQSEFHATALIKLAPLFHALETLNQRFLRPGHTQEGAPIRATQGHNFSYCHFATELADKSRFPDAQRTVLVNWDAHADLSDPFENPRLQLPEAFNTLLAAGTYAERAVVASYMSIAGWILPLVYQGLLSGGQTTEVIWVVPKEAIETSKGYMEPYGRYEMVVGDWRLPTDPEQIKTHSTVKLGDWIIPGSTEIRRYSDRKTLCSIDSPDLLGNKRTCVVHIVDADDEHRLAELLEGANIALSIDADFSGTREPGLTPRRGYLPHYPLNEDAKAQARHDQLLDRLAGFFSRFREQVRAVTVANSPNFTVDESTRRPVAKILRIVTEGANREQPKWLVSEINRAVSGQSGSSGQGLRRAAAAGGLAGLLAVAGILTQEHRRLSAVRSLLFTPAGSGSADSKAAR